jgi:hypothetical protein
MYYIQLEHCMLEAVSQAVTGERTIYRKYKSFVTSVGSLLTVATTESTSHASRHPQSCCFEALLPQQTQGCLNLSRKRCLSITHAMLPAALESEKDYQIRRERGVTRHALRSQPSRCRNADRRNVTQQPHNNDMRVVESARSNAILHTSFKHVFASTVDSMVESDLSR